MSKDPKEIKKRSIPSQCNKVQQYFDKKLNEFKKGTHNKIFRSIEHHQNRSISIFSRIICVRDPFFIGLSIVLISFLILLNFCRIGLGCVKGIFCVF
jgi:hypothetical protein